MTTKARTLAILALAFIAVMIVVTSLATNSINGIPASDPLTVAVSGTTALTLTGTNLTTTGTLTSGAKALSFITAASFVGSINGATYPASTTLSLPPVSGYAYPSVPYIVTSGSIAAQIVR